MGLTLAEKILLAHSDAEDIAPGDFVMARCDVVMANDLSTPHAAREIAAMGAKTVFDRDKVVLVADHFMPAPDTRAAELQKAMKDWAHAQGVTFYDQGRGGIEHTLLVEEGWIVPGSFVAGADSHTCTYGALGAFGTGMGVTDIAGAMAIGRSWQIVPGTILVEFAGDRKGFVTGKDLILAVIAELGVAGATNMALEFAGSGVAGLSIDERLAVSNMAVEAGADTGLFPADDVTAAYLEGRTDRQWTAERSDPDVEFGRRVRIDLSGLRPLVSLPHSPGNVVPVDDVLGRKIDQVYIGNCANGTITDLRQTAEILRGHSIHPECRAIVVPATQRIYRQALAEGLLDLFVEAGCVVSTPTCGACFGGHMGVLAGGENAITTTNRNFRGRMGSPDANIHLANAWVAAAAAVAGEIVDPADIRRRGRMSIEGTAVVIAQDNVDTDVLYPGRFLNVLDPAEMPRYLFEGFDPSLREQLTGDTILVAWENFGTGSSRENVPTAMKAAGIHCVLAKSFARIFHRNCINLGLPAIACPEAVAAARPGSSIHVETATGVVDVDGQRFQAQPLPPFMLELLAAGGLVPWIRDRLPELTR